MTFDDCPKSAVSHVVAALAFLLALAGCTSLRLHDESRAKLATEAQEAYSQADIPGILDVEGKNLDLLLQESLKVSRENHQIQLDLALLSIAANQTPMASTLEELPETLAELGFRREDGFSHLRDFAMSLTGEGVANDALRLFASHVRQQTGKAPPPCVIGQDLPAFEAWGNGLPSSVKPNYDNYARACATLKQEVSQRGTPTGGLLGDVARRRNDELEAQKSRDDQAKQDKSKLDQLRKEYQSATDQTAFKDCARQEQGLVEGAKDKLDTLKKALAQADKADLSVSNNLRIQSLLVLLEGAAGGKVDTSDKDVAAAARIAQEFPSLWGDMCALIVSGKAPPVANLLLSLQHAMLLVEFSQQQKQFSQARITLLNEKEKLLREAAAQWQRFHDAVCSFAVLSANPAADWPGEKCSQFKVTDKGKSCSLGNAALNGECALAKPWSHHLRARANTKTNRELYKALLAYQRAFALRARASEIDFRLVDALHRETLARKRFAVEDWDNLVGSAVSQLDAYFKAGIKPAEIADLIVKAAGFTAVAIGAAQ